MDGTREVNGTIKQINKTYKHSMREVTETELFRRMSARQCQFVCLFI